MGSIVHWVFKADPTTVAAAIILATGFALGMALLKPTQVTIINQPPEIKIQERTPVLQIRKLEKNLDLKQVVK